MQQEYGKFVVHPGNSIFSRLGCFATVQSVQIIFIFNRNVQNFQFRYNIDKKLQILLVLVKMLNCKVISLI
jgi:hypothetical protein